jgi:hypothetical protein
MSYSESHIHLDSVRTNLTPLMTSSTSMLSLEIEMSPPPSPPLPPLPPLHSLHPPSAFLWIPFLHKWALHFTFHLTLIGLFETLFFWHFVSESEDSALITLVNKYTAKILVGCANLTQGQKELVTDFMDLFINQTRVDTAGFEAETARAAFNYILFRNSWLYFGALLILFAGLATLGRIRQYTIHWKELIAENLALVIFLGLYEWMFFSTVVLPYESISVPELDRMVVNELANTC